MLAISLALSVSVLAPLRIGHAKPSKSIQKDIKTTKEELSKSRNKEKKLDNDIKNLSQRIQNNEREIQEIKSEIKRANREYKLKQKELKKKKAKFDEGNENLKARLRKMYKNGGIGFMDVILSSDDISSLIFNVEMVQKIYENDNDLVMVLQKQYEEVKEISDSLKKTAKRLEKKEERLSCLQDEMRADKKNLTSSLAKAEARTASLNQKLTRLQSQSSTQRNVYHYHSTGRLTWPLPGNYRVTSGFAYRNNPKTGIFELHRGIDIPAPTGCKIVAAADGRVVAAGYSGSYGNRIKIKHGGSLTTLYAHCSCLLVRSGQWVKRGEIIARCGSTGRSTGPHLHFEVQINDIPRNPRNYL